MPWRNPEIEPRGSGFPNNPSDTRSPSPPSAPDSSAVANLRACLAPYRRSALDRFKDPAPHPSAIRIALIRQLDCAYCSPRNYARDLRPAGYANTEAEARVILMRVFEGIYAETSIEVKFTRPAF